MNAAKTFAHREWPRMPLAEMLRNRKDHEVLPVRVTWKYLLGTID
jgi:hypothetical protein